MSMSVQQIGTVAAVMAVLAWLWLVRRILFGVERRNRLRKEFHTWQGSNRSMEELKDILETGDSDPERERQGAYYRRTGQIVCDRTQHPERLCSGLWYGYEEWLQDILTGQIALEDTQLELVAEADERRDGK